MEAEVMSQSELTEPTPIKLWVKRITLLLIVVGVIALLGYMMKGLFSGGPPGKKAITTIKLLPDTPPPPPPPPKEPPKEEPKEQPKEIKEVPQPKPEETPPAEVLKMEGAAGDGPSPFAAGAVSNEYKGGDVGTKIGGGPSKYQFAWYTGLIKTKIEDAMAKDKDLANGSYKAVMRVWVARNGKIERYELVGSSGDPERDMLLKKALDGMSAIAEPPPADMPQPIKLRLTARSIG